VCYSPDIQKWFIFQTNRTIQHNVPVHRYADQLLELSSVEGHPKFYWNFDEVSPFDEQFKDVEIRYESAPHFILSRFAPNNIFHAFHDDIIGLYFMMKEYMVQGTSSNHHLLFFDEHGKSDYDHLYKALGEKPLRYKSYLESDSSITCFQDAVFGNSKVLNIHDDNLV
jgi:protein O-mannose beta-1,4-N-acetylglucosaminyltransferase